MTERTKGKPIIGVETVPSFPGTQTLQELLDEGFIRLTPHTFIKRHKEGHCELRTIFNSGEDMDSAAYWQNIAGEIAISYFTGIPFPFISPQKNSSS